MKVTKKVCAGVPTELLWRAILCANPRPDHGSQSGSWSRRELWRLAPHIMPEYNLMILILIRPLYHPGMCERGSSSLSAMSRIRFARTNITSFLSMPSTERTNE